MGLEITEGQSAPKSAKKRGEPQSHMTFSQQVIAAANRIEYVDFEVMGLHRRVGVRAPKGGDGMRLARILSAEDTTKPAVFNQAMLAFCITELDGEAVPRVATELGIEALLDRLGTEGIAAAAKAFEAHSQINGTEDIKN